MKRYTVGIRIKSDILDDAYHPYTETRTEEEAIKVASDVLTHREEVISAKIFLRESTCIHTYNKEAAPEDTL